MKERVAVILLAAGQGLRAGIQKQWTRIGGRPHVSYSLETMENHPKIQEIYLGVPPHQVEEGENCLRKWAPTKGVKTFPGGARRQDTVYNGLKTLSPTIELVGIHDAARPLVSPELITRVLEKARAEGAAIPVIPLRDTVKEVEGERIKGTLNRNHLRAVQTPQFFRKELIAMAYEEAMAREIEATDDSALVEALGQSVAVVEGEEENLKVTYPQDFKVLEALMGLETMTGLGYDVHPLVPGRKLVLGGVEIPHNFGLLGHSDADVLCHAVVDALLGAAGLGDIGHLFPDSDPFHKDRSSLEFLEETARLLEERGFHIVHIDATLVMEKPKVAPYKKEMAGKIGRALGILPSRINIKATTTEKLGFTGRGEGIAAYAVATIKGTAL